MPDTSQKHHLVADLLAELSHGLTTDGFTPNLQDRNNLDETICWPNDNNITGQAIRNIASEFGLAAISPALLQWQIQEMKALNTIQPDVPKAVQNRLLLDGNEAETISSLWQAITEKLAIHTNPFNPEALLDLPLNEAEALLAKHIGWTKPALDTETEGEPAMLSVHEHTRRQADKDLAKLFASLGTTNTLPRVIQALSGIDSLSKINPQWQKVAAALLPTSNPGWPMPKLDELGLYGAWRASLHHDITLFLHRLPDWQNIVAELPESALPTISLQLTKLDISTALWPGYLKLLLLELPDWPISGASTPSSSQLLADYLAIRLTLDRLWLNQICHDLWKIEAKISSLTGYFRKNLSEFMVRQHLYQGDLPEYLTQQAETLIIRAGSERQNRQDWQQLADLVLTWQLYPTSGQQAGHRAESTGWRLFRLCQHLGLTARQLQNLSKNDLLAMLAALDS